MRIDIDTVQVPVSEIRIGNVYPISGGWGRKCGHLMVLVAITKPGDRREGNSCLFLIVDRNGEPVGVTHYGLHAIEERTAIAFVEGMDDLVLRMRGF